MDSFLFIPNAFDHRNPEKTVEVDRLLLFILLIKLFCVMDEKKDFTIRIKTRCIELIDKGLVEGEVFFFESRSYYFDQKSSNRYVIFKTNCNVVVADFFIG